MEKLKNIILKKALNESLTESESGTFNSWIEDDSENIQLYEQIKSFELSKIIIELNNENFGDMMTSRFTEQTQIKARRGIMIKVISTVSAAAVIALSFLLSYSEEKTVTHNMIISENNIVKTPKLKNIDEGVRLITPNEIINLDDDKNININELLQVKGDDSTSNILQERVVINTLIVPLKREYSITLSDGTKVWMNSGSQLIFPSKFCDTLRSVELIGEAYFEVTKNEKAPFIVNTKKLITKVLGTEFMVSCYDEKYEVSLVNGRVNVNENSSGNNLILTPGKGAVINAKSGKLEKIDINIEKIISRKNGLIMFDEDKLSDITYELEKWYGVDFVFENEALKHQTFYMKINKYETIKEIMELLKYTKRIDYEIINNNVLIKKYLPMN